MKAPRFEVFAGKRGQWRWRLRARNGRILCQGEAHTRKADAVRAVATVMGTVKKLSSASVVNTVPIKEFGDPMLTQMQIANAVAHHANRASARSA